MINSDKINIYTCGVTVYDISHIGHARTIVIFDLIRRLLIKNGYQVNYIQNFTDLDDKIIEKAKNEKKDPSIIANRYIDQYFKDFDDLHVMRANKYTKATEYISSMQKIISVLIKKDYAYKSDSGIYFDISKFPDYGKLSKININQLRVGVRVDNLEDKEDPADFALWKFYKEGPTYGSPWGKGRPGWHIECSTMIYDNFGGTIDIHGGGEDLIFPHHENEIAQSEAFTGKSLAHIWIHVGLLNIKSRKMSKSLKNTVSIKSFLKKWGPNTLRFLLLSSYYRNQTEYTEETLKNAVSSWKIIEESLYNLTWADDSKVYDKSIITQIQNLATASEDKLLNDLNTPEALSFLLRAAEIINSSYAKGYVNKDITRELDSYYRLIDVYGFRLPELKDNEKKAIGILINKRNEFRTHGNFEEADSIRKELSRNRIEVIDQKTRTCWRKVEHDLI